MSFKDVVTTPEGLHELYRSPSRRAVDKQIDHLDAHCRDFIAHATFVLIGTSHRSGTADVSPKGGAPGFVRVLDENRLAIPDMAGNNRLDSMQNLVSSPGIGLLFLVPGIDETLRVNGFASITTDPDVLDACEGPGPRPDQPTHPTLRVRPRVAIGVDVSECFIHCAKALRRGSLWHPDAWPDTSGMATIACMLRTHAEIETSEDEIAAALETSYRETLWQPGGQASRS